ncbi:hypothetical protein ABFX02_02G109500 [Erythranthe guttata]
MFYGGVGKSESNPMEWYFANNMENLTVPKDEEMMDRLPSPDSWSSWGKVVGNFNSPKKLTVLGVEDFLLNDNNDDDVNDDDDVVEQLSTPRSRRQQNRHQDSDSQLNNLSKIDDADDIFFRSIFEADASSADRADSSASFRQASSNQDQMAMDNLENFGHFLPSEEMEFETSNSDEHFEFDMFEDMNEEDMSTEESVLLELQTLALQLANKTRVCFRDSLYRLAENSRLHQNNFGQNTKDENENGKATTSGGPYSARESQAKRSDTNAIDRTIATLLFNTIQCCNITADTAPNVTAEKAEKEYQANDFYLSGFYEPSLSTTADGDAEVPTFGLTNQRLTKARAHFSDTYAMAS